MIKDSLLRAANFSPNHLQFPNSWVGHIPFAAWLMKEIAPKMFVELGTHSGNSYFAFCQAVVEADLSTKCYSVDTWEGDSHAGYYGKEIFANVSSYNEAHYSGFSRLMRMTFDEAKEYFADQSIDLLHIDGLHTYEAVKHDFVTWLPKLAVGAVVIFHDINVREQEFGVWKFWDEIRNKYPLNFEFIHSHGLGILQLENASPIEKLPLLVQSNIEPQLIRNYFSAIGFHQLDRYKVIELEKVLTDKDQEILDLNQRLSEDQQLITERDQLNQQLITENQRLQDETQQLQILSEANLKLQKDYESLNDTHLKLQSNYENLQTVLGNVKGAHQESLHQLQIANETFEKIFQTKAWKAIKMWWKGKERVVALLPKKKTIADSSNKDLIQTQLSTSSASLLFSSLEELENIGTQPIEFLDNKSLYEKWIQQNELSEIDYRQQAKVQMNFEYRPLISILTPIYNTDEIALKKMIDSILSQTYSNWELCLVDGFSTKPYIRQLLNEYAEQDKRIKVKFLSNNLGISENSNKALNMAEGEFIALLDHDDELSPNALFENVFLLNNSPNADVIYSDEDKMDENGLRCDPYFKPDWSPDFFCSSMYTCHLGVYRKSLVDKVGGFRSDFDGAQDWDLVLRITEKTNEIYHIPKVLYHWRMTEDSTALNLQAKDYATAAQIKAVSEHFERLNIKAEVTSGLENNLLRVRRKFSTLPKVSIIIPTRDRVELLRTCIESIKKLTSYQNYEILVIDNNSSIPETLHYFEEISKDNATRVIKYPKDFNFSAINNFAVTHADGELLLFLNNDTEVISSEWLESMIEHAVRPEVGAVGARLLYSNDTVQHAGVIIGIGGVAGHSHKYLPKDHPGYFSRAKAIQNLSAVTAACMMVRKEVFNLIGGFNEKNLAVAFNDVDFCLRIRQKGLLIVYTPYAELYHHESVSRGSDQTEENSPRFRKEVEYMMNNWRDELLYDPYYNHNLTLKIEDFSIKRGS